MIILGYSFGLEPQEIEIFLGSGGTCRQQRRKGWGGTRTTTILNSAMTAARTTAWWNPQHFWKEIQSNIVHTVHLKPIECVCVFLVEVIKLLMVQTNRYYCQYLNAQ